MTPVRQALLGATVAASVGRLRLPGPPPRWLRTNHRGEPVSLVSGPALAAASALSCAAAQPAAACAGLLAAALGAYDDVAGATVAQSRDKGFRGHLSALRERRVSAGLVKVVGIGASAALAVGLLPGRRDPVDLLLGTGVVAGSANLLNLLDLRPGRALKVGLVSAVLLRQPGPAAAVAVLLPADLGERQMLGDAGANALGAVLGLALAERTGRRGRAVALGLLAGLTAASEVVSFSQVIDRTPLLHAVDQWGRRR